MTGPRYRTDRSADQRNCALYYIDVLDVTTNYTTVRRNGYIGETAREPFVRFLEHLYEQPFGDLIVGPPRVDPRVFAGKGAVLAAEQEAVERLRPQYNHEWNLGNPDRIPIPEARRQRDARDAAKGVVAPGRPARWARTDRLSVPAPSRRQVVAATWAALSGAGWWGAAHLGLVSWSAPAVGCLVAAVLMALAALTVVEVRSWWNSRRAREQRRRLVLRVTALTVFAALGGVLYLLSPILLAHLPTQAAH